MLSIGRRTRRIGTLAALGGALVGLLGGLFIAAPAFADDGDGVLQITKTVNKSNLVVNDTLVYTIAVDCSTYNCVGARLTDTLPPEFDALTLNTTPAVSGGPSTFSWGGTNNRTLTVDFTKTTATGNGIPAGTGYSVQVSLTVPSTLPADWPSNGHTVTNTARVSATNAAEVSASATATITVPYSVNTTASAAWAPASAQFKVGDPSSLTLSTRNTSNAAATSLTLLAPTDPTAASSLFEYLNLTGFGALVFPAGADRVQVDAYVAGAWIDGPVGADAALDGSITDLSTVRGLRITFTSSTGSTITASGSAGSLVLQLGQRSATRTAGTSLISGATVTANVTGSILVPTQPVKSVTASATYAIGALTSAVSASTSFTGARIAAGTSSRATLTGKNLSNGPLATMTITQPTTSSLFGPKVTFGGFSATGLAWPNGATGATVTWFVDTGSAPAPTPVAGGANLPATPALDPGQKIIGFAVEFSGAIAANATAAVPFVVNVAEDAVAASPGTLTLTNGMRVDGLNDAGAATPQTASANLVVLYPQIGITMTKSVTPSATTPVPAGGRSIVQLRATTSSDSGFVTPTEVTILDQANGSATDYWNAFNVVGVAPTQVLAGSTLLVQYTLDGTTWIDLGGKTAGATADTYQDVFPPADAPNIVGVRFVHSKAGGFSQSTTLVGNLSFQSRATDRLTSAPTSNSTTAGVSYTNSASVNGTGTIHVPGGGNVSGSASASAPGGVISLPGGSGGELLDKAWTSATVDSQSGQTKTARIRWGTQLDGYSTAVVQEPSSETAPVAGTVFQAFDLTKIEAITTTTDPLIAFDQVSDVELYMNGVWTSVKSSACSNPANCQGKFNGFTLNATQQANTTAVRITFSEWAAGRSVSTNPLSPPVGSGVASSPSSRQLDFTFRIRNQLRDASATPSNPWVTAARSYNTPDPGSVSNTAKLTLGSHTATDADTIVMIDRPPAVTITKAAQNSAGTTLSAPIAIPSPNDTAAAAYPVVKFSMTGTNASAARAWYLRITDQMPCTTSSLSTCAHPTVGGVSGSTVNPFDGNTWDPATSPFEYFTIEKVTVTLTSGSGIVTGSSSITFWKADGTNETVPLTDPKLTNATYLADVVGVSALLVGNSASGGTIVSGGGATILLDTRLRKFTRSTSTLISGASTVTNSVFSQDWDGVLDDTAAFGSASANVALTDAKIDVAVTKSFSVSSLLEANRATPVTVTLHADQATATASLNKLVVSDTDAAFWNSFELRSLTSVTMPLGSDRVHVEVQTNGGSTWTAGATVSSNPALPAGVTLSQVTGLRYVFERSNGGLFSVTAPSAAWSTDILFVVRLRAATRDGGASIPFPGSVSNTATATVSHPDLGDKSASATRALTLDPGTFAVDVEKRRSVATSPAGETLDFRLIVKNTGTGYLDNPVVTDQLPIDGTLAAGGPLLFDPTSETTYSTTTGGILPTTGVGVDYNDATRRITFTWPTGSRLAPGETYTVVVPLQLAPGLQAVYGDAVNRMTFTSDRTLSACTNTSGNGEGVSQPGGTKFCSTTSRVQAVSASAISSFKGVKGDVDALGNSTRGAANVNDPTAACVADSEGFYRNPCAANTVVGGTDLWKVQYTNGGNVPATSATVVDVLPKPGDLYLGTGTSRGSTFRPVFAGGVALTATGLASGVTLSGWQVTTTASPCPAFASNPTCTTATWVNGPTFSTANYGQVTGLRFQFDFTNVTASPGTLPPAAAVTVNYKTVNTPTTTSGDNRAPVTAPVVNQRAWNTFGVYATFGSGFTDRRVEPVRAGVQLSSGALQVAKAITGVGAAYAPTSFAATVSCTVAGVAVVLPSSGALTLAAVNGTPYTSRLDGIPVGSDCDIVENTAGASSVAYSPAAPSGTAARLSIATAGGTADTVPLDQRATITNDYGSTSLTVTKHVSTSDTAGATFGPFTFTLSCTVDTGTGILTVPIAAGDQSFTLADGDSRTITDLPVTARCALAETGSDSATRIGIAVDGGSRTTVTQGQAYTVTLGTNAGYTADVLNVYDGGQLTVTKTVVGAGASFGTGPFSVHVVCTYDTQTLFDGDFTLLDGGSHQLAPVFPVGTSCAITETDAGGATSPAAGSSVTIPGPVGVQTVGAITAGLTNRFDTGSLKVVKARTGSVTRYGDGPFTAQVTCTWDKPGSPDLAIPLPNAGIVTLDAAHGYEATVTGLIGGADCDVAEQQTGGSTSHGVSSIAPAAIPVNGTSTVTITNDYATGSLVIDKVRTGPGVAAFGDGPFTASVDCVYESNGAWLPIAMGRDASVVLDSGNAYHAVISDLIVGAECTVAETDAGLATSTTYSPAGGVTTIVAAGGTDARVVVSNDFQVGHLDIEKTASESIVQGAQSYDYEFVVKNVGDVDAAGVEVVDVLDPTLKWTNISAPGWASCDVTGEDVAGYGGTLTCELNDAGNPVLAVGATAPTIVLTVEVLPEIAQDDIVNDVDVTSTTTVVSGDHDSVTTPVKWLDVVASPVCIQDAPWLSYTVDAHNLDVNGHTMTMDWKDSAGTVIHTDSVPITASGVIHGDLLWPGAAVDTNGDGIAWPGWRAALPGETPDWENLILDPAAYGYGLRNGATVDIHINPSTTVSVPYPGVTSGCETPGGRLSNLWLTKDASTSYVPAGGTFDYTIRAGNDGLGSAEEVELVDDVPSVLRVISVTPDVPTDPAAPAWISCVLTNQLANGYGGTITCDLDRPLAYGETVPEVTLHAQLDPQAAAGQIVNVVTLTAEDSPPNLAARFAALPRLSLQDDATILTAGRILALTGMGLSMPIYLGGGLLAFGLVLLIMAARRRRRLG